MDLDATAESRGWGWGWAWEGSFVGGNVKPVKVAQLKWP